jgi:hypothetical protein
MTEQTSVGVSLPFHALQQWSICVSRWSAPHSVTLLFLSIYQMQFEASLIGCRPPSARSSRGIRKRCLCLRQACKRCLGLRHSHCLEGPRLNSFAVLNILPAGASCSMAANVYQTINVPDACARCAARTESLLELCSCDVTFIWLLQCRPFSALNR